MYKIEYDDEYILLFNNRKNALQKRLCLELEGSKQCCVYPTVAIDEEKDFIEDEIIVTGVVEHRNGVPTIHSLSAMLALDDSAMRTELTIHDTTHIYFCDPIGLGSMVSFVALIKTDCNSSNEKDRIITYIKDEYMKWRGENVQN